MPVTKSSEVSQDIQSRYWTMHVEPAYIWLNLNLTLIFKRRHDKYDIFFTCLPTSHIYSSVKHQWWSCLWASERFQIIPTSWSSWCSVLSVFRCLDHFQWLRLICLYCNSDKPSGFCCSKNIRCQVLGAVGFLRSLCGFLFECRKVINFASTMHTSNLKNSRHFQFHPIGSKTTPIVPHLYSFSRALPQLHVITSGVIGSLFCPL